MIGLVKENMIKKKELRKIYSVFCNKIKFCVFI